MTLVAKLHLTCPDLPFVAALAGTSATTVEVEATMTTETGESAVFAWVHGGDFVAFASALADGEGVTSVQCLDDFDDRRLYRVDVESGPAALVHRAVIRAGASNLRASITHEGLDLRLRLPDRDALVAFRETLLDAGVDVTTRYLSASGGDDNRNGLTRKQLETLAAAVEAGYFAVPREATLADVAAALGVSRQAASERLRRGMETLARNAVDEAVGVAGA